MKSLLLFLLIVLAVNTAFARTKIVDGRTSTTETKILCGETDSLSVLMNAAPFMFSKVELSISGAKNIKLYGYFMSTEKCTFPTNGDLEVSVRSFNVFWPLICFVSICILLSLGINFFADDTFVHKLLNLILSFIVLLSFLVILDLGFDSFRGEWRTLVPLSIVLITRTTIWGLWKITVKRSWDAYDLQYEVRRLKAKLSPTRTAKS